MSASYPITARLLQRGTGIPLSFSPLFMRLWIEWSVEDRHRGSPRFGRFRHLRNAFNDAWHNGRRSDGIDEWKYATLHFRPVVRAAALVVLSAVLLRPSGAGNGEKR
jgi:hypothetical protein